MSHLDELNDLCARRNELLDELNSITDDVLNDPTREKRQEAQKQLLDFQGKHIETEFQAILDSAESQYRSLQYLDLRDQIADLEAEVAALKGDPPPAGPSSGVVIVGPWPDSRAA